MVSHRYVHYGVILAAIIIAVSWFYLGIEVCLRRHEHMGCRRVVAYYLIRLLCVGPVCVR